MACRYVSTGEPHRCIGIWDDGFGRPVRSRRFLIVFMVGVNYEADLVRIKVMRVTVNGQIRPEKSR
jgi:hypothetical protein